MNSFGLGLILNFTDNASAGMNRAAQSFQNLNGIINQTVDTSNNATYAAQSLISAGLSLNILGTQAVQTGQTILSAFSGVSQAVLNTGMSMMGFKMQLSALYGSDELGLAKLEEIKKYAMSSVFEVKSLVSSVSIMKAVGIEAMNDVTSSTGRTTQKLMDYASDLAAMMPNMRNVYGTGVDAAMGALKEYIAEGNAMSLKRGAGLDITQILGVEKGKTIEERTRQIADLIEKMGIAGYTMNLYGTPTQRISNLNDALYNSLAKIAESGVLEAYSSLLEKVSNYVMGLVNNEEKFNKLTGIVSEVITALFKPISKLLDYAMQFVDWIIKTSDENPNLVKNILITIAALGGFLVASGYIMKATGSLFMFVGAISMLRISSAMGVSAINVIGRAFSIVFTKALPFLALAGMLYLAWKNNVFGIRDTLTQALKDIGTVFSLVTDAWTDDALTEDNFKKARELGLLPFIESIIQLKYHLGIFADSFKKGFNSSIERMKEFAEKLGILKINVFGSTQTIGDFLNKLTSPEARDTWEALGEITGNMVAALLVIVPAFKLMSAAGRGLSFIARMFTMFKGAGSAASSFASAGGKISAIISKIAGLGATLTPIFAKIGAALSAAASAIGTALSGIAAALGISVGALVAVIVAVIAAIALIIVFRKEIAAFFKDSWDKSMVFWGGVGNSIKQAYDNMLASFADSGVGKAIIRIISAVKYAFETIKSGFGEVFTKFGEVKDRIFKQVGMTFDKVAETFGKAYNAVKKVFDSIGNVLQQVWRRIDIAMKSVKKNIKEAFGNAFNFVRDHFTEVFTNIYMKFKPTIDKMRNGWINFKTSITDAFHSVAEAVERVVGGIVEKFNKVKDAVITAFENIALKVESFFTGIREGLSSVGDFFTAVGDFFAGLFNSKANKMSHENDRLEAALGLASGGYIKTQGIAVLHPNEVVVNDTLTKNLRMFLDDYSFAKFSGNEVPVVNNVTQDKKIIKSSVVHSSLVDKNEITKAVVSNDNKVTFEKGSIVLQVPNTSEAELEKTAEKLMKIIARKKQLRDMAVRK